MLFLDRVYISGNNETSARFRWVKAPTLEELTQLTHTIVQRTALSLERQELLVRNAENSYLTSDALNEEGEALMNQLLRSLRITHRIAVGPQ